MWHFRSIEAHTHNEPFNNKLYECDRVYSLWVQLVSGISVEPRCSACTEHLRTCVVSITEINGIQSIHDVIVKETLTGENMTVCLKALLYRNV